MIATRSEQCQAMAEEPEDATSHREGVIWLHGERFIKDCRSEWDRVTGFTADHPERLSAAERRSKQLRICA